MRDGQHLRDLNRRVPRYSCKPRSLILLVIVIRSLLHGCRAWQVCINAKPPFIAGVRMQEGPRTPTHKVALSIGFVGSRYHGYQADSKVATIEQTLRSVCGCGAMGILLAQPCRECIGPQPDDHLAHARDACKALDIAPWKTKIKPEHRWTSSSRTDARVHAARMVVIAPLCLPPDETDDGLAAALNAHLPHDIRVHAAKFLHHDLLGLDARAHCSHRCDAC
jgi:hypothetical protein